MILLTPEFCLSAHYTLGVFCARCRVTRDVDLLALCASGREKQAIGEMTFRCRACGDGVGSRGADDVGVSGAGGAKGKGPGFEPGPSTTTRRRLVCDHELEFPPVWLRSQLARGFCWAKEARTTMADSPSYRLTFE